MKGLKTRDTQRIDPDFAAKSWNDAPLKTVVLLPAALLADWPLRADHPQTGSEGQVLTSLFQPINEKKLPHT